VFAKVPNQIVNFFPQDYRIPGLYTWSLRVERQIAGSWVASAAYVGNKGSRNDVGLQLNPAIYIPGASTVANTQSRRLYPVDGPVAYAWPGGNSQYQALQLAAEKRSAKGLTVVANYTFSKNTDNQSATNPFNAHFEHALSAFDVPNNLKISAVWLV